MQSPWVEFRIRDVMFPDPPQLLIELHGGDLLRGRVIDLSDSGAREDAFAVVEVDGIDQPVVVPIENIERMSRRAASRWAGRILPGGHGGGTSKTGERET